MKFKRILLLGLSGLFIAVSAQASIEYFYNMPPEENPFDRGPRANLIRQIDSSTKRLEGQFYQIGDPKIVDSFARAARRDLDVILATDFDWYEATSYPIYPYAKKTFEDSGVTVVTDFKPREDDPDEDGSKLSHNKYLIIDRNTSRARVWAGSTNITPQGSLDNANASFLFKDKDVADIFHADFKQMAAGDFQKEKGGVFHVEDEKGKKTVVVVHDQDGTPGGLEYKDFAGIEGEISYPSKVIDGTKVEFYFSPRHNIQQQVVELLYSATESIHFASYGLDNRMIYQTIMNKALVAKPSNGYWDVKEGVDSDGNEILQRIPYYEDYNLLPVAIRAENWKNVARTLRVADEEVEQFNEFEIDKEMWKALKAKHGGAENEGKFYGTARYFYPPGKEGGPVTKVPVYGIFNRLGAQKGPYPKMLEMGIPVRFGAFRGALHHKFIIIDKKILILGSYNFSTSAEKSNDESLIIIRDEDIVEQFYEDVYVNLYKRSYPEREVYEDEMQEYGHDRATLAITEVQFNSPHGSQGRYVELYNYGDESIDMTGWKMWNGNIPYHKKSKVSGSTDDLISFYNRPLTNAYDLNHPTEAYFLTPDLQVLHPGEIGLVVGRDFDPDTLLEFFDQHAENFKAVYDRDPKQWYERYPKLFICSMDNDSAVGSGLKPYNFITLFYPDKFTIADRFVHNWSFRAEGTNGNANDILFGGEGTFKFELEAGHSIQRVGISEDLYTKAYDLYVHEFDEEFESEHDYRQYWYGLAQYSSQKDWQVLEQSPGFLHE